jgi:hypothetical protein
MGENVMTRPLSAATVVDPRLEAVLLRHEIETFNTLYAAALDEQRLMDWVELFDDNAHYVVLSRENFERNLPVGLIYCENKGMIRDRAFALKETAMFAPITWCCRFSSTGPMRRCIRSAPTTIVSVVPRRGSSSSNAVASMTICWFRTHCVCQFDPFEPAASHPAPSTQLTKLGRFSQISRGRFRDQG